MSKGELKRFATSMLIGMLRFGGHPKHIQNIKDVLLSRWRWRSIQ